MEKSRTAEDSSDIGVARVFLDESISRAYAQHRHCYSEELFQIISDYCRENTQQLNLAIDVGCGPGNSTVGFTKHFKQVIGVDMSETQIAQAPKNIPNCQFKLGFATNLDFLEPCSVDLVACGLTINLISKSA
ncbi:trans-aconitate 2-methyltransferase [Plakobranchus ocellatus]|uniref:Trans-aconitate 2-methyltransferase n=1 Tax=Plakobranchus ocellatus TaxID=259542 RepID=A0AAV3YPX2_9GAST|nr:trans-aconitate 2-methyltransferase [Plakobranchus ocellatus]